MTKLLYLLSALVAWLERVREKRQHDKAQRAHDELESNWGQWYDNHFGATDDDDLPVDSGLRRSDADGQADKAHPRKSGPG